MNQEPIKDFTDLECWKCSKNLAITIYDITKGFPKEELFGLTSQIRRSSVSIPSNIAEGFSRKTFKDKIQFYSISQGSLTELQSHLHIVKELNYLSNQDFNNLYSLTITINKLINGLIKKSKILSNTHDS